LREGDQEKFRGRGTKRKFKVAKSRKQTKQKERAMTPSLTETLEIPPVMPLGSSGEKYLLRSSPP